MSAQQRTQCPKCKYFSGDDWKQCRGSCPMNSSPHYDPAALATPSQRLDAATVERCAQVVEQSWVVTGHVKERVAEAIRALATEPHQHGAGNGEKHGG